MHLCYFDENKHSPDNPHFFIGGLLIPDDKAIEFEKTLSQIVFNFFGSRALTVTNERGVPLNGIHVRVVGPMERVGDTSATGRNIRGMGRLPTQYRDTRTRSGNGYELEVTFNPTRAFRLTGNLGLPRLYEANAYPDVRDYIDKNAQVFRQIANDAGVIIGSDNVARVDESIPINQRSSDASNAATAYNNIYSFRRNIVDGTRRYAGATGSGTWVAERSGPVGTPVEGAFVLTTDG